MLPWHGGGAHGFMFDAGFCFTDRLAFALLNVVAVIKARFAKKEPIWRRRQQNYVRGLRLKFIN